jgi:cell division protease FtsH
VPSGQHNGPRPDGYNEPNYGAPPGWTPATTPSGQSWTPSWERPGGGGGVQDAMPGRPVDTDDRESGR